MIDAPHITDDADAQSLALSAEIDGASYAEIQAFVTRPDFSVRRTLTSRCRFDAHAHASYTVTMLLAGQMQVCVGENELTLNAGDVAFTGVGQLHAAEADGVDFVSIRIQPALVNEMAAAMGLTRATAEIVFRVTHTADEALAAIARRIAAEATEERAGHQLMLDALVRELSIHLLRSYLTVRKSAQIELSRVGPVDRRLRRALEFMHDNYARELALEEIAASAYLSEYHFARLFKQVTGATPHVYLANLRIEKARRLLTETAHPIIEIAAMVGYQSQSHFTKIFKAITGLTPRAYRESSRQ
jgi:AraC family transcriptional regulator